MSVESPFPKDTTLNRMVDFMLTHEIDEEELRRVRLLVCEDIQLRGVMGLEILVSTEQAIREEISQVAYLASAYLKQPIPDEIGFLRKREGAPDIKTGDFSAGASIRNLEYPNGAIWLSPFYLTQIAKQIEGKDREVSWINGVVDLTETTSHEVYHIHESYKFRKTIARDQLNYEGGGYAAWDHTMSEVGARIFSRNFVEARKSALISQAMSYGSPQLVTVASILNLENSIV